MGIEGESTGRMGQGDCPDWEPLRRVVGEELLSWFMWMFELALRSWWEDLDATPEEVAEAGRRSREHAVLRVTWAQAITGPTQTLARIRVAALASTAA